MGNLWVCEFELKFDSFVTFVCLILWGCYCWGDQPIMERQRGFSAGNSEIPFMPSVLDRFYSWTTAKKKFVPINFFWVICSYKRCENHLDAVKCYLHSYTLLNLGSFLKLVYWFLKIITHIINYSIDDTNVFFPFWFTFSQLNSP